MNYLLIICIILSIIDISMNIVFKIMDRKPVKESKPKNDSKEKDFDEDEYINSIEFNRKLDNMIVPLIGKYSNENIVKIVTSNIIKKETHNINRGKLAEYVTHSLSYYNNTYTDSIDEEIHNPMNRYEDSGRSLNSREIDISDTMRNFYE